MRKKERKRVRSEENIRVTKIDRRTCEAPLSNSALSTQHQKKKEQEKYRVRLNTQRGDNEKIGRKSKSKSLYAASRVKGMGLPCLGKGVQRAGGEGGQDTTEQGRGWMSK